MKTSIVLLAAIVCAVADPQILYKGGDWPYVYNNYNPTVHPIVRGGIPEIVSGHPYYTGLKTHFQERDVIAKYGHTEPDQLHHAVQDAFGNKVGRFSYYDPEGKLVETNYVADGLGYRVLPKTQVPIFDKAPLLPTLGTHEIVKRPHKILSLGELDRINFNFRSKRDVLFTQGGGRLISPISPISPITDYKVTPPHALPTTFTQPKLKVDGFLEDTPEVKHVKNRHLTEIEAAKLRNLVPLVPFINQSPIIPSIPLSHRHLSSGYPFYDYRFIDHSLRL